MLSLSFKFIEENLSKYFFYIFILSILTRILFAIFSGIPSDSNADWTNRYDIQSSNILEGKYNLEQRLFITAPLYSYFAAIIKLFFGEFYKFIIISIQVILSAISVILIAKTANIIFNTKIALISGVVYALYPITLYFTHILGQESLFQSLFIFFIYHYFKFLKDKEKKYLFIASIFFTLAFLTKSHIIFVIPFIVISLFLFNKKLIQKVKCIAIFLSVVFLLTLPYGIYNYKVNGMFVFSSSGHGGMLLISNNDQYYKFLTNPPPINSKEHQKLSSSLNYDVFYKVENNFTKNTNHSEKQSLFFKEAINWIINNKSKYAEMVYINFINVLKPGFNKNHYPFKIWLFTLIVSIPVFLIAYFEIFKNLLKKPYFHHLNFFIILSFIIYSITFYQQGRFRVITLEPIYLMYFSSGIFNIFCYMIKFRKIN